MGREAASGQAKVRPYHSAKAAEVEIEGRRFLVVGVTQTGKRWNTYVLERLENPFGIVLRREAFADMAPDLAALGYLNGCEPVADLIQDLRSKLTRLDRAYIRMVEENIGLKAQLARLAGRGGKHVRRNS